MQIPDVSSLSTQVLWASFFLSALFGAIAQRSHFCTMGAVSDVVNMGDWTRMRQWAMAAGIAMIAFEKLQTETDMFKILETREQLLEYCKLDTLAMVKIFEVLEAV